jgi:dihydroorotate dehydrogenase
MISNLVGILYTKILKPILFRLDPEFVHDRFTLAGRAFSRFKWVRIIFKKVFRYEDEILKQNINGINFSNPVGLSAGFDKDANLHNILYPLGFGFAEIGSVTFKSYGGNPKPRLYRLPKSKGLVVYYGLKSIGVDKVIPKLKKIYDINFPLAISVAKTNSEETNTVEKGVQDYVASLVKLEKNNCGNLYVLNISCPNTFGGEPFTTADKLDKLLKQVFDANLTKPIYIKMPINLPWDEFESLVKVSLKYDVAGLIIGNLNKDPDPELIKDEIPEGVKGGISGIPTQKLSNDLIRKTYEKYGDKLIIVGTGGIFSAEDAYLKIKLGASLVQLITGMIFNGPQFIGQLNKDLAKLLREDGYKNISEAVGAAHRK